MSKLDDLKAAALSTMAAVKAAYVRKPGTGAVFFHADNETGEIARIEGVFQLPAPAKLTLRMEGCIDTNGTSIHLKGEVEGHPKSKVVGILEDVSYDDRPEPLAKKLAEDEVAMGLAPAKGPDKYAKTYKKGSLTVTGVNGKPITYKVNSKIKDGTQGPYRFMWFTHDQTRVPF